MAASQERRLERIRAAHNGRLPERVIRPFAHRRDRRRQPTHPVSFRWVWNRHRTRQTDHSYQMHQIGQLVAAKARNRVRRAIALASKRRNWGRA